MPEIFLAELKYLQYPCPWQLKYALSAGCCLVPAWLFSLPGDPIKVTCTWHLCDDDGIIVPIVLK